MRSEPAELIARWLFRCPFGIEEYNNLNRVVDEHPLELKIITEL